MIVLESGKAFEFDGLKLATGADPVRLPIEGATDSQLLVRAVEPSATTGAAKDTGFLSSARTLRAAS